MFSNRSGQRPVLKGRAPHIGENRVAYAIGDIHGCAGLLAELLDMIRYDARSRPKDWRKIVVFLGDYVDRGPDTKGVIDLILDEVLPNFEVYPIIGNHEVMMLEFLQDPHYGFAWRRNGGLETLRSYGALTDEDTITTAEFERIRDRFDHCLPTDHRDFFGQLHLSVVIGDYAFVHAGVRPGVPLDKQEERDLLWIRNGFLNSTRNFGKIVVHGHTPNTSIQVMKNRIGLDTGAYFTGLLSCAVLAEDEISFLQTKEAAQIA